MQLSLEEKNKKALEDEKIQKALVIGLVCGFIFMISVIGLVWYCHSRRKRQPSLAKELPDEPNLDESNEFPIERKQSEDLIRLPSQADGTCNTIHTFHTTNKDSPEDRRPAAQDIFAQLQPSQSNIEPYDPNDFKPSTTSRFTVVNQPEQPDVTESPM